ncbi:FmdB family zinc ribbon protein [Angustibacter aerolatus]
MPTYPYACTQCGHQFEVVQAFTDDALTTCPECSGRLRKVFGSVGVVFKGSGFYRTDSRGSSSAATPAGDGSSSSSSSSSSSEGGSSDGGSKPAKESSSTPPAASSTGKGSTGGSTSAA